MTDEPEKTPEELQAAYEKRRSEWRAEIYGGEDPYEGLTKEAYFARLAVS